MNLIKYLLLATPSLLLISCLEETCDTGPFIGEMQVKVTINEENPEVHVVIFDGKIEDQDTLISEFVTESSVNYDLESGFYYSATARYTDGIREVVAVDGKKMQTTTDDDGCEYADDFTLNLRLAK